MSRIQRDQTDQRNKRNKRNKRIAALFGFVLCTLGVALWGCGSAQVDKKELSQKERARLLVEVANGALLEGDPTGALQNLVVAEKLDPTLPELYHTKALAYYTKHDLARALPPARRAVELKPDYLEANNTLGKILVDLGQFQEAIKPLEFAAFSPVYREAYKALTTLGMIQDKLGNVTRAEMYYNRAIEESPGLACQAYYARGNIEMKSDRLREAVRDFDRSTKRLCAYFSDGRLALGMAYEKNKQFQLARKTFLEIQKLYPHTQLADRALERLKGLP